MTSRAAPQNVTFMLEFVRNHRSRDVIELPTLRSSIQLNGKPGPTLDCLFLILGFERHGLRYVRANFLLSGPQGSAPSCRGPLPVQSRAKA